MKLSDKEALVLFQIASQATLDFIAFRRQETGSVDFGTMFNSDLPFHFQAVMDTYDRFKASLKDQGVL
ncbi:hypothetical protein [Dehalococcoides mccartyi]|uniref:hypothetical protein n=1 Tax=Dehalococcoides mccartyi TaxID=61435 RepID=UPI00242AE984|nr:hypothetical protein [Dehalococcoides mccartyi]